LLRDVHEGRWIVIISGCAAAHSSKRMVLDRLFSL
jgi:hypothetical protein